MSDTKMTQKEMYAHIAEAMGNDEDVVAFCKKKIEQLEHRAQQPRRPRFNAEANEFALELIEVLKEQDEPKTNKELVAIMNERHADAEKAISPQKVAAALRKIDEGKVMTGEGDDMVAVDVTMETIEPEKASDVKRFAIN